MILFHFISLRWFLFIAICAPAASFAADWPPELDPKITTTQSVDGRTIERYTHGPREAWGYPAEASKEWEYSPAQETGVKEQNHNSFYVVAPKKPRPGAPLCVVLHSANRTAYDYLGYAHLNRGLGNREDPTTIATHSPDDFYALYLNSTNAEWWGMKAHGNISPAEKRIFDSIEWVVTHYEIDRNRIYLCGVSMGGCGTLAIGMPHGDVFAAIRATVPAGTEYAGSRMGGFPSAPAPDAPAAERETWLKTISGVGLPDPPIVVDFSAQNDNWSKTQPPLLRAAQAGRLPLLLSWGPFHHTSFDVNIARYPLCDVALAFPWQEIRKNEAYPVFTNASTDQHCPWLGDPVNFDESGQINAWFRWKNKTDTPSTFTMELWLAHPKVGNPPANMPDASTVDVTLRRLQHFKIDPEVTYTWQFMRGGKSVASGICTPDVANLLTIPRLTVTKTPGELSVNALKK